MRQFLKMTNPPLFEGGALTTYNKGYSPSEGSATKLFWGSFVLLSSLSSVPF